MRDTEILPPQRRENPDPHEGRQPVPRTLLVATVALAIAGVGYIANADIESPSVWGDQRSRAELQPTSRSSDSAAPDGPAIFTARCAACHQASGLGLPGVFPPLAGSEWVNGDATRLGMLVLNGVTGSLSVKGQTYNGAMPAFKAQLTDAELAALLTHLRSEWGNAAGPVDAGSVASARARTRDRTAPFNGGEELAAQR